MIVAIGEWVLRTACFAAGNWPEDVAVAVNLSPVQFRKGTLVATVRAALALSALRPNRLELEITESILLRDTEETLTALRQLCAMGIAITLDDFGTGYSSLSYLRSFPFQKIKIDQSFVQTLAVDANALPLVRAIIAMGHNLNLSVTAEGVETEQQLDLLRQEECDEVQGFLLGRPMQAKGVDEYLRASLRKPRNLLALAVENR